MSRLHGCDIAIVSDDRMYCDGLAAFLQIRSEFVVHTYCPGADVCVADLGREYDLLLIDARDPTSVWSSARPIPHPGIVMYVGAGEDDTWATSALAAGARGILPRSSGRDDLFKAIDVVRAGGIWARRRWLNACVRSLVDASRDQVVAQTSVDTLLSRREREVLQFAATGMGNKELADRLSISEATVKVHLTHIFQKLGIPGRAALAASYHHLATSAGDLPPITGRTTNGVRVRLSG
jgi:DNA-binding NarL/FixJ family response regulator